MFRLSSAVLFLFLLAYSAIVGAERDAFAQQTKSTSDEAERGVRLYEEGDVEGALKALRVAVKEDKEDARAWYYFGLANNQAGLWETARYGFVMSVRLRPDFAPAYTGMAYTLLLRDEAASAMQAAQKALALGAQNALTHYVIGAVALRGNDFERALVEADAALKINEQFPPAYLLKSDALARLGRLDEAIAMLNKFYDFKLAEPERDEWLVHLESIKYLIAEARHPSARDEIVSPAKEVSKRVQILERPNPAYTKAAERAGVRGIVALSVLLGADGKVRQVGVLKPLAHGLTREAIAAARRVKFKPALKDNHPVAQWIRLEYCFRCDEAG